MAASKDASRRTPWRYQARCPAVAGSCEFTTAGVRTFLPFVPLARGKPAITRLTRWPNYTTSRGTPQSLRPIAILLRFTSPRAARRKRLHPAGSRGCPAMKPERRVIGFALLPVAIAFFFRSYPPNP